jgi:hypothetical protein
LYGRNLLSEQVSSKNGDALCMADKMKGMAVLPKAAALFLDSYLRVSNK